MQKRTRMLVSGGILLTAAFSAVTLAEAGFEQGAALAVAGAAMADLVFWSVVAGPRNGARRH